MPSLDMCLEAFIGGEVLCTRRYRNWTSRKDAKEASDNNTQYVEYDTDKTENSKKEMQQFNTAYDFVPKGCPAKADQK